MTAPEARPPRRTAQRFLLYGIIIISLAAWAASNDGDELSLTPDSSVAKSAVTTPASASGHQGDEAPRHNHTGEPPADLQVIMCPSGLECAKLGGECIDCNFNTSCVYGQEMNVTCSAKPQINCTNTGPFQVTMVCRYCYQVAPWEQTCMPFDRQRFARQGNTQRERERYRTNCTARSNVVCLGQRTFPKYLPCNSTAGYKWTTALVLSITLGGFGADRFYLGHWQEGIGKLFSFGGLGVWTLLDVILIAVGYLGPADGSLYIW